MGRSTKEQACLLMALAGAADLAAGLGVWVVGLGGLEPPTSSLSVESGRPPDEGLRGQGGCVPVDASGTDVARDLGRLPPSSKDAGKRPTLSASAEPQMEQASCGPPPSQRPDFPSGGAPHLA
jgi:hypothetical protein